MSGVVELKVEIKTDEVLRFLGAFENQMPYARALAINNTLKGIQLAERKHIHETYHLRRPDFIDRSVYIGSQDWARKDKPEGTVRINPARDVLGKFEDDTVKRSRSGNKLAIPVFREENKDLVIRRSDPLSLNRLMAAIAKGGTKGYGAGIMGEIKRRRQKGMHGPMQRELVFLVKVPKGKFLVQRIGAKKTRVLYAFKQSVPITPNLRFKEIALEIAQRTWSANAEAAITRAIETAR